MLSPQGASFFNRFASGDIENAIVGGLLVLLFLLLLEDIVRLALFPSYALNKRAIDRYIIFSRLSSMRGLSRLALGREWPSHMISNASPRQPSSCFEAKTHLAVEEARGQQLCTENTPHTPDSSPKPVLELPRVKYNLCKLLLPFTARFLLLAVEFGAIYLGTKRAHDVNAGPGFDLRLVLPSDSNPKFSPDLENACDNFLSRPRAGSNTGELLRCVTTFSTFTPPEARDGNTSIALVFDAGKNELLFRIVRSLEAGISNVRIQVLINSLDGEVFTMAPLRPDLQFQHSLQIFTTVVSGAVHQVGDEFAGNLTVFPGGDESEDLADGSGRTYFLYSQLPLNNDVSIDVMASALTAQLRALPLGQNSSGLPWLHDGDSGYIKNGKAVIATIELNRIAHGVLLIMVMGLWLTRVLVQRCLGVGFEEVGWMVCQSVFEDDSVRESVSAMDGEPGAARLRVRRFAFEGTGHLGYLRSDNRQHVVSSFEGCDTVI